MKKTVKTTAVLATAIAVTATSIPFNVLAATPTVISKYTEEEQAAIKTIFNPTDYAEMYPDVAAAFGNDENKLFEHYLVFGITEDRAPSKSFNVNAYASSYPDLQVAFGDDVDSYILHYATLGQQENRTLTTIEAANQYGYSVYSVSSFKTGVKGVSGVSLLSGGAIKLTDRNTSSTSDSDSSSSSQSSKKKIITFTITSIIGQSETCEALEGWTIKELIDHEPCALKVEDDGYIIYTASDQGYLYNIKEKRLAKGSDVLKQDDEFTYTKDKNSAPSTSISFKIGDTEYNDAHNGQIWKDYISETNKDWPTEDDHVYDKEKKHYLVKDDTVVKDSDKIEADATYTWKENTTEQPKTTSQN